MKTVILLSTLCVHISIFSQTKKEEIILLDAKIDSIKSVINLSANEFNDKFSQLESNKNRIDSLTKELKTLNSKNELEILELFGVLKSEKNNAAFLRTQLDNQSHQLSQKANYLINTLESNKRIEAQQISHLKKQELLKIQYNSVKIGPQVWMKENLDVAYFKNGEPIPEAKSIEEWKRANEKREPAWCYYNNIPNEKNGKLYNWFAIYDPRGLAPEGWHIATDQEWLTLEGQLNGSKLAGYKMKSAANWIGSSKGGSKNGTNESGFSAYPSGMRNFDGIFSSQGVQSYWWAAGDPFEYYKANMCYLIDSQDELWQYVIEKGCGLSVRCIKGSKLIIDLKE
jgi:uncharacterized protein (TIGR02145 family)